MSSNNQIWKQFNEWGQIGKHQFSNLSEKVKRRNMKRLWVSMIMIARKKTSSTPDKEEEKSVNVLNVLLNIYECVKNIFQWMYKCAWTALEQIFYCILDWKSQSTISLGLFRFIHNYILYFCYVRKYHLDMNDIYFKAVNITKK